MQAGWKWKVSELLAPHFMNVNFIPTTHRVEPGADLHLGFYRHSPGDTQSLLIALPFLLLWWDACRERQLCHSQRTQGC